MQQRHGARLWRNRKLWLIAGILALVALWIASGVVLRDDAPDPRIRQAPDGHFAVAVRMSRAQPVERVLVLQGDLQPDQVVLVRAETPGQVETWHVPRGGAVEREQLLAELELGERRSTLRQAQARLNVAEQQLRITQQLAEEGYEPDIQLQVRRAELQAAEADVDAIQQDIRRTRIRAPIPGRVDRRIADVGDYVAAGGEVAQIVNNDPLRATVQVPQQAIGRVALGQAARVTAVPHGQVAGEVTYVSTLADPATRTFRVEVEVPNPQRRLPAGTSVEVEIPTEEVLAHRVSPAILGLDDQGRVGVKTVDDSGRVAFYEIEPVRAEREGIWVAGLPERARIITVGQGFVTTGEQVLAHDERVLQGRPPEAAGAAATER
ncbi:MAG: efflux RND transporter periplasmic adaptor subunit [Pseudomonadales bacterium]